jgi:hypothetical protein
LSSKKNKRSGIKHFCFFVGYAKIEGSKEDKGEKYGLD